MKEKLIELFKASDESVVSGEQLSQQLGVSRVSIWKHIKKLQEMGYDIQSGPKGYQLRENQDLIYSWEFPSRKSKIRYFEEVESTMVKAKELAQENCEDFTVVIADRQKKGRGRLKRYWESEKGGLYFTIVLRPQIAPMMMSRYSFAASVCLAEVLINHYGIHAKVKWPNDILVNNKKISGMLCEMELESNLVSFLNIGIGLNVNNNPQVKEQDVVSMQNLLGNEVSRKEVLSLFLDKFEEKIQKSQLDEIIPEWKKLSVTLNKRVRVVTTTETWEGQALDVDETGALVLKLDDESTKTIFIGDCFHGV